MVLIINHYKTRNMLPSNHFLFALEASWMQREPAPFKARSVQGQHENVAGKSSHCSCFHITHLYWQAQQKFRDKTQPKQTYIQKPIFSEAGTHGNTPGGFIGMLCCWFFIKWSCKVVPSQVSYLPCMDVGCWKKYMSTYQPLSNDFSHLHICSCFN